jgi:glycerol-3-phosphate acyltransferase PlsX
VRFAVDAMGGDTAPENPVAGAVEAARDYGVEIILTGHEDRVKSELQKHDTNGLKISVVHAEDIINMEDKTADAMRSKKRSSIHEAVRLVKNGDADAMISAGHTGATMAASKIITGSLKKVKRPALAIPMPTIAGKPCIFLDVGANVQCRSEHLVQFAIMGNTYAKDVFGIENPKVGVFSNGEEATKGNEIIRKTITRLEKTQLNFGGPAEAKELFSGEFDVVVTDGFTGNAILKSAEAVAEMTFKTIKNIILSKFIYKIGALLMKGGLRSLKDKYDYSAYGGAPLLGLNGVSIICHGRSNPTAIKNAVRVAREFVEHEANAHIQRGILELYEENILGTGNGDN